MHNKTLVSIIMPVYNCQDFLDESIKSILSQTYDHFEFIIINDASIDLSEEIILSFNDSRINYYKNAVNMGPAYTRNKGLELAKGEYYLLMDSDDISDRNRIETLLKAMANDTTIGICGSWVALFYEPSSKNWLDLNKCNIIKHPLEYDEIKANSFVSIQVCGATIMMRSSLIKKYELKYNTKFIIRSDYDFILRASFKFKVINFPEVLYYYRIKNDSHFHSNYENYFPKFYKEIAKNILKEFKSNLKNDINIFDHGLIEEEFVNNYISAFHCNHEVNNIQKLDKISKWLIHLSNLNNETNIFNKKLFLNLLSNNFYKLCYLNFYHGLQTWKLFINNKFSKSLNISLKMKTMLLIKIYLYLIYKYLKLNIIRNKLKAQVIKK
ncbi:MAG: glycosyltransferase family 2 protein [Pseudomonadota bacterium]